ncbi:MAG: citramalate synthase [Geitlerinemataceae cyanobacterium]
MTLSDPARSPVTLYDTTLRDGAQCEGIALSLDDKLRIAHRLDALGIPFIEGGWPGANPKDGQFFARLQDEPLQNAQVVAFCSTRRVGRSAADEPMLVPILEAETKWVTVFGKSWDLHVTEGLQTTLDKNLETIADTLTFLKGEHRRVIYDAEHWFDGYKRNASYAVETLLAAIESGAQYLTLCDTNGGTLPHEIAEIIAEMRSKLAHQLGDDRASSLQFGIHAHNDSDTAVANTISAVRAGATMVQGTIDGYGERCGNANLCSVIPNLQLKLGYDCLPADRLPRLTETSRFVSEIANLAPDDRAPFVGRSAFAHKGGIHVSAVRRNPITYEHLPPETIGNRRRIVISDQSGTSNILAKAQTFGLELDKTDPACREILQRIKNLENQGYQFEGAEASFDLLMRQALGQRPHYFDVRGFQVHCTQHGEATSDSLATVKITVRDRDRDRDILEAAEGNGPVSALDAALRRALTTLYPEIEKFHLTDYKVRILDGNAGTSAKTRVLVESTDGFQRWTTVGVSDNIIDASYQAVAEALEYGLLLCDSNSAARND